MSSSPSLSPIGPTNPYHISRAYGLTPPAQASRPQSVGAASQVGGAAAAGPAAKLPSAAQKLVGATVPGRVDFSGDKPTQVSNTVALPMYRHPADKNAAATAVSIGRSLDVSG